MEARISMRIPTDDLRKLDTMAKAAGMTRSAYVREVIARRSAPPAATDVQTIQEMQRMGRMVRNFLRHKPQDWTPSMRERFEEVMRFVEVTAQEIHS